MKLPRQKPASPDVINDLKNRVDQLLKKGIITKDFIVSTEEASVITGLSAETLRHYAQQNHIAHFKFPGKNFYPLKALCDWVEQHYQEATVSTSEMNRYKSVKTGRPKKKKGGFAAKPKTGKK
jgi:hypothetical protein